LERGGESGVGGRILLLPLEQGGRFNFFEVPELRFFRSDSFLAGDTCDVVGDSFSPSGSGTDNIHANVGAFGYFSQSSAES